MAGRDTRASRGGPFARLFRLAEAHPGATIVLGIALAGGALVLNDRAIDAERTGDERAREDRTDDEREPDGAPDAVIGALAPLGIDEAEVAALTTALGRLPPGTPVWIAYPGLSSRAAAAAVALGVVFQRGGAVVRETRTLDYSVRPGLFVFAAEEEYPSYVDDVAGAIGEAIPDVAVMSGYRAYVAEQRATNPAFQGVGMEGGEDYFIVIGRVPDPE